jgi:hypothetical protein
MPQAKTELVKLTANGSSSMTIDLAKLLPLEQTGDEQTETIIGMDMGGKKQNITMRTDTDLHAETK